MSREELVRAVDLPEMQLLLQRNGNFGVPLDPATGTVNIDGFWNLIDTDSNGKVSVIEYMRAGKRLPNYGSIVGVYHQHADGTGSTDL